MLRKTTLILTLLLLAQTLYSQNDNLIMGKPTTEGTAAVYNLSDPTGVNIEVNLWGFVRYPGRYIIPYKSTFLDVMSYSGGPIENSNLEEIRILRPANDSLKTKNQIIKLNYDDYLWNDDIKNSNLKNPVLQSGDVIIVMEQKRYSFREDLSILLPVLTSVISLATFIITATRK